jgi:linoleoyl-CoA desaturase
MPPIDLTSRAPGLMEQIMPTAQQIAAARKRLQAKAVIIALTTMSAYYGLVIADVGVLVRLASALVLVGGLVAVATSIMHDANHSSFGRSARVNRMVGYTADLLGASSWLWRFTHNNLHHGNTNVVGVDPDIDQSPFGRMAPGQPWHPWHRYQHVYMWFLYGFVTLRWLLISDFVELVHPSAPRPVDRRRRSADVSMVFAGKALHLTWAVAVPLFFHRWWAVLAFYLACSWVVGFTLAVIFQVAHCVDTVGFVTSDVARRGESFASHQLETTANVRRSLPVLGGAFSWIAGGLDHQIEHHLAPRLPHTIYPLVAERLQRVCADRGLPYHIHRNVFAAVASHGRWLRLMAQPPAPPAVVLAKAA